MYSENFISYLGKPDRSRRKNFGGDEDMLTSKEYISLLAGKTEPALAFKEDISFEDWQQEAHAKLEELLGLPLPECEPEFQVITEDETDEYTSISFTFQSEPGYRVPCTLLVPKGVDKPIPGVICLQGHSKGAHISLGKVIYESDAESIAGGRDFAVRAVKEGFCAIAMEQRYMGVLGGRTDGEPACLGLTDDAAMGSFLMGRTPIGERVWDVHKLIDVIEKHLEDYIDPSQIICMGNSGGGTATFYASCYDRRICLSIPSCAVCTYDESIMAMMHCPCNCIPGIRKYFNMGDLGGLIAPRPAVIVCGVEDDIFPLAGVEKSYEVMRNTYERIGKGELCRLVKGNVGHQFYPDDAWPVVKELLEKI